MLHSHNSPLLVSLLGNGSCSCDAVNAMQSTLQMALLYTSSHFTQDCSILQNPCNAWCLMCDRLWSVSSSAGYRVALSARNRMLQVLALQGTIPRHRVRDTALYPPLMGVREKSGKLFSRSLKNVAADELGISIQAGEHDPVQDARAALYLYHKHRCAPQ